MPNDMANHEIKWKNSLPLFQTKNLMVFPDVTKINPYHSVLVLQK